MEELDRELALIVARAAPLAERLAQAPMPANDTNESTAGAERVARWAASLNQYDALAFSNRLEWSGWYPADVRAAVDAPSTPFATWPRWAHTMREIVTCARDVATRGALAGHPWRATFPLDDADPIAFEHVLLPVVLAARARLRLRLGSCADLLTEPAWRGVERSLLVGLERIAGRTLDAEFSRARPPGHTLLRRLVGPTSPAGDVAYRRFVDTLLASGLLALFRPYPVLARLLAAAADAWVEATAALCSRLEQDLHQIEQRFGFGPTGKVAQVETGLSDPHRGGATVARLTFESGVRVIYKPRNVGMEAEFTRVLAWCNDRSDDGLPFRLVHVLAHADHGWVEHIDHAECADDEAGRRFYRRAGKLLCLVHALRGTDCHWENIVASGEHPVLVDVETLLQHEPPALEETGSPSSAWLADEFHDSVVRTGLLPRWQFDEHSRIAHDISGLGAVGAQRSPRAVLRWTSVNSDDMHLSAADAPLPIRQNAPMLHGRALSPDAHLDQIVAGFRQMYHFLIGQRAALLEAGGPLSRLASQRCRFLLRHTEIYSAVQHLGCAPDALRDGADRSIVLDALSRGLLTGGRKPRTWSALAPELAALEALDIPYIDASPASRAASIDGGDILDEFFDAPSDQQAVAIIGSLDVSDLEHQIAIIRGSFSARVSSAAFAEQMSGAVAREGGPPGAPPAPALGRQALLSRALALATEIEAHAQTARDGSLRWISLGQVPNSDRYEMQPLGPGLFDGYCGVALFLAAMDSVTPCDGRRERVLACLRPLCDALQHTAPASAAASARRIGLGGATGLGSVVYCLTRASRFLDAPRLLEGAARAAAWINPELIAADADLDIVSGSAGAVLGLLCLHAETGEPAHLTSAIACGRHVLERRTPAPDGARAWKTRWARPLTGFSHGAAGIAYALLRLAAATGDRTWLDAAREAINYERRTYSAAMQNWPDFRSPDESDGEPAFMMSWCHGAPGIALARLGGLPSLDDPGVRDDIAVALHASRNVSMTGVDHLCCGNFGRVEVLQVAAQRLARPDLARAAQRLTEAVVGRAGPRSAFRLLPELPYDVFCPGFFHGTSGIGYQLLRQALPESLPSVLLWE